MGEHDKLFLQILQGGSDKDIRFNDLCQLMKRLGFEERVRGSHHIFRKKGVIEKVNLQRDKDKAKAYQVRQIREIIHKYNIKVG